MYKFTNSGDKCEILIYDLIDEFGSTNARAVIENIKQAGDGLKAIDIRINSAGGDVFEALSIYNFLKSHKARINIYIDGLAASAASVIACAGKIYMPSNALMMLHNPQGYAQGESEDMRAIADVLDKIRDNIAGIYAAKTGKTLEECAALMSSETWMTAEEAANFGFADKIIEARAQITNSITAERERMKELDDLNAPGCEREIYAAKYETFKTARDVAFELLKAGKFSGNVNNITADAPKHEDAQISRIAAAMNARRKVK